MTVTACLVVHMSPVKPPTFVSKVSASQTVVETSTAHRLTCRDGHCEPNHCDNCDSDQLCIYGQCQTEPCLTSRCLPGEQCYVSGAGPVRLSRFVGTRWLTTTSHCTLSDVRHGAWCFEPTDDETHRTPLANETTLADTVPVYPMKGPAHAIRRMCACPRS